VALERSTRLRNGQHVDCLFAFSALLLMIERCVPIARRRNEFHADTIVPTARRF
jgi:hypothetical protein